MIIKMDLENTKDSLSFSLNGLDIEEEVIMFSDLT